MKILKAESGTHLGFSSSFLTSLEAWANTPEVKEIVTEMVGNVEYGKLKSLVVEAKYTEKEILLEALCASISSYLIAKDQEGDDMESFLFPLTAHLFTLGAISFVESH
jgi:hypothetical protein